MFTDCLNYWFVVTLVENKYCSGKDDYVVSQMAVRPGNNTEKIWVHWFLAKSKMIAAEGEL